jgi:hypothetical protein
MFNRPHFGSSILLLIIMYECMIIIRRLCYIFIVVKKKVTLSVTPDLNIGFLVTVPSLADF